MRRPVLVEGGPALLLGERESAPSFRAVMNESSSQDDRSAFALGVPVYEHCGLWRAGASEGIQVYLQVHDVAPAEVVDDVQRIADLDSVGVG